VIISAVILAAGKGVRMSSDFPKVVHKAAGKPMILHIVQTIKKAGIEDINVVVGHGRDMVYEVLKNEKVRFVAQEQQLGTGHALIQAQHNIDPLASVMVLAGDTPLLRETTLKQLIDFHREQDSLATVLTAELKNPTGYGRIIRNDDNSFLKIVEEKDASENEKKIKEINSGIYCFQAGEVFYSLNKVTTNNAQGEYYLTDALDLMKKDKKKVSIIKVSDSQEVYGVNDRIQLSYVESILRKRKNMNLMQEGVTIVDPAATYIDEEVQIGRDTRILPYTIIEGNTVIGKDCEIGPYSRISNSNIGDSVIIDSSRVNEAAIGTGCIIGPYAYLRPQTELHDNVKVGDFVEIKKSTVREQSKIPHLSYIGDAMIGKGVNIGAGTITCNYDGKNKYRTIIEDQAFIGSNTNLVAPVTVSKNAVVGAGSTITQDVGQNMLAVERAKQKNVQNWVRKDR